MQELAVAKRKASIKKAKIATAIVVPILVIVLLFSQWIWPELLQPAIAYGEAQELLADGQYDKTEAAFDALGDYRNATGMVLESRYQKACWLMNNGDFDSALSIFSELSNYSDSEEQITNIIEKRNNVLYTAAQDFLAQKQSKMLLGRI